MNEFRDRQLTTNFELWVEIFCVPMFLFMWEFKNSVCLPIASPSVRTPRKKTFVNISPTLANNWYIKRMISMSTTAWKPKNLIFFQNFEIDEIEFCPFPASPYPKKRNHLGFIDISPPIIYWYINGKVFTSTTTYKPNHLIFFKKVQKLNFDLWWRAEINIQVGLNMNLYDYIGDASSLLRGSTSSFFFNS